MPSHHPDLAVVADPARSAAREIRRLSEVLAMTRFEQVLDEAGEWVMWLGAAVPRARGDGRPGAALREASRGFEIWLARSTGLLLALGSELMRRAEQVRSAALACLRGDRAHGELEAGRRSLEVSLLELERALARARTDVRRV